MKEAEIVFRLTIKDSKSKDIYIMALNKLDNFESLNQNFEDLTTIIKFILDKKNLRVNLSNKTIKILKKAIIKRK